MSIQYAILGILSCKALTGYDLKKIIQDSPFMHWSGNNNQIYKSLTELLNEGFVTSEIHHQDSSPSKKIYTITEKGLAELKNWVFSPPDPPEFKKAFLVKLAWADQLSTDELDTLLSQYEYEVKMQIILQKELKYRGNFSPNRTPREALLWNMIYENLISSYENELEWVKKLQKALCSNKEVKTMDYSVHKTDNKKYIFCDSAKTPIGREQDALDLIAACMENETNLLLLHMDALSEDFFQLRTGLAGNVLQKFMNYHIKAAVVINDDGKVKGRFKELLTESNKGNHFRVFHSLEEARQWLVET